MKSRVLVLLCFVGVLAPAFAQNVEKKVDTLNINQDADGQQKGMAANTRSAASGVANFASQLLSSVSDGNYTGITSLLSSPVGQGVIKALPPDVRQVMTSGNISAIASLLSTPDAKKYLQSMVSATSSLPGSTIGQLGPLIGSILGNNTSLPNLIQSVMAGNLTALTPLLSSPAVQGLLMTLPPNIKAAIMSGNLTAITSIMSSPEAQAYLKSALAGVSGNTSTQGGTPSLSNIANLLKGLTNTKPGSNPLSGLLPGVTGGSQGLIAKVLGAGQRFAAAGVSQSCQDDLQTIFKGLMSQQMWAIKMVDAMGKIPDGVLSSLSSKKFLGDYDECTSIATDADVGFKTKFCRSYLYVLKDLLPGLQGQTIGLGTCVSNRCDNNDIEGILKTGFANRVHPDQTAPIGSGSALFINGTSQQIMLNETLIFWPTSDCLEDMRMGTGEIAVICILIMFAVIMTAATLYDAFVIQLNLSFGSSNNYELELTGIDNRSFENEKSANKASEKELGNGHVEQGASPHVNGTIQTGTIESQRAKNNEPIKREQSTLEKVILSFSVYTNGVKILSTEQGSGSLGSINGIRFLSMAWVILGHTYFFTNGYDENLYSFVKGKMQEWTFMFVPYATVSVDSFFAISGVLVGYLTLKELRKTEGPKKFKWPMFYFHRFWRLTPPYMLLLMVGTVLVPYFNDGPLWAHGDNPLMHECRDSWWTNLLYVNNYVKTDKMCMGWSWYLANDMQFYIISPLILIPFFYNVFAGVGISAVLIVASWIATGTIASIHHYPVQSIIDGAITAKDGDFMKNIYFPSYARIGPYLVGLFTGYLLYKMNLKCKIPRIVNVAAWLVCIGLCFVIVYSPYSKNGSHIMGVGESAAYMTLIRTFWGAAVCWIVFACACGYGGWINQLLSWKAFIPLGRLTYCAYLVHPVCINVFGASLRRPYYFNDYTLVYLLFGTMVTSYGVAFVASLAFESPMMALEKVIFKKGKK